MNLSNKETREMNVMGIVGLLSSIALFAILTIQKWSVPFICLVAGAVIAITSRIPLWNAFFD